MLKPQPKPPAAVLAVLDFAPRCEQPHTLAEWAVWLFCPECGTSVHLMCSEHRSTLSREPGRLWRHHTCGTPDTRYLKSERL